MPQLESVKDQLNEALASLTDQADKIKKALFILDAPGAEIVTNNRKLSPEIREKIRQAALKRWAGKKKKVSK